MRLIGWHGTTNKRKAKILSEGFQFKVYNPGKEKERHPNDLGNGIYFFLPFGEDNGKNIAVAYVKKYKSRELLQKGIEPVCIGADLSFEAKENIFCLDDLENQLLLQEFRVLMEKEIVEKLTNIKNDGAKRRATKINQNQGLVIEILLDLARVYGKNYDAVLSITYTDLEVLPVIDGKNGKEICVRNRDCITSIA
ncbi:hypothetical protein JDW15_09855 [Aerococcaceae bacterium zg-ZJ1578]|uniref:hypothetical protein n=1 Tax=Aerococcaceae bacterium zg-252 TaxID=2796928 RepID=UPI001A31BD77|nr:hypothetical protein [Aerococcaceae bacterium zg-1578]